MISCVEFNLYYFVSWFALCRRRVHVLLFLFVSRFVADVWRHLRRILFEMQVCVYGITIILPAAAFFFSYLEIDKKSDLKM